MLKGEWWVLLQILVVTICMVVGSFLIKKESPVFVSVMALITGVVISIYMLRNFSVIAGYINILTKNVNIEKGYIKIIMKITGLSIATQLVSDICKDNGFNAVATQLELMCRISIAVISMPVIIALLEMVNGCLK